MAGLIDAREIAVATVDGRLAGAIRVRALAADHRYRGIGQLVAFAERHCSDRGLPAMQLELLVPRTFRHPGKEFLDGWYRRIGYRVMPTTGVAEVQAGLSPLLATPCDFVIYRKPARLRDDGVGQAARVSSANVSTCSDSSKRSRACSHVKPGQRYSARPSAG